MKQLPLILNAVLIVAVAALFYMSMSLKKNVEALGTTPQPNVLQTPATLSANNVDLKDI